MTRIVSGSQEQDPNFALMQGLEMGRSFRKAGQEAQGGMDQGEQIRLMLSIQNALRDQQKFELDQSEHKAEVAKAGEAQRQVDKAGRLQQSAQRAQAGQFTPGQKFVERVIGARGRLKDPKALAMFDASVEDLLKSQKVAKQRKAAEDSIGMAEQDVQDFTPEDIQMLRQRLDSGENLDTLTTDISKQRTRKAEESLSIEENDQLLAQAQQLVDAASDGFGKEQAKIALRVAMRSDSLRKRKGSGAVALKQVEAALLGPRSEYGKQGQEFVDPNLDPKLRETAYEKFFQREGVAPTEEELREQLQFLNPGAASPFASLPPAPRGRQPDAPGSESVERSMARPGQRPIPTLDMNPIMQAAQGGARGADIVRLLREQGLDPGDPAVLAELQDAFGGGG